MWYVFRENDLSEAEWRTVVAGPFASQLEARNASRIEAEKDFFHRFFIDFLKG